MGSPKMPTDAQLASLIESSKVQPAEVQVQQGADGQLQLQLPMTPNSAVMVAF